MRPWLIASALVALTIAPPAVGDGEARPIAVRRPKPEARQLHYRITGADGQLLPAKLTVLPVGSRHRPRLGPRTGTTAGLDVTAHHRVFSLSGQGSVAIPRGTFDVIVSSGPEWDIVRKRIDSTVDDVRLIATLHQVVDTSGWIAADLHVHAEPSSDSVIPIEARVAQLVSEGVEFVVSTDHNMVSDYGPTIARLGAGHLLASARGSELTTGAWGHLGVFPYPASMSWLERGAVTKHAYTGAAIIAGARKAAPNSLIIVNHPHSRPSSYLRDGGWDPRTDRARPGFSWDFDAIEIVNGYHRWNLGGAIERNLRTWFRLMNHGHLVAAVGSSDTHQLRSISGQGGYARTYVAVADDRAATVRPEDIVDAIKRKRAIVSTGPFVRVSVAGKGLGELAPAPGGHAFVDIEVQAAPWVPTSQITVYVGGVIASRIAIPPSRKAVRMVVREPIHTAADSYVVVRVDGRGTMQPIVGESKHEVPSIAITNPVFLDADGDGKYRPAAAGKRHKRGRGAH